MSRQAIIIGAGPAGLTAAYELLKRTDITPIILEKSGYIGGISRTIDYKGNRMDMGPHRFFSKSDRVMNWWLQMMPLEPGTDESITIKYQNKSRKITHEVTDTTSPIGAGNTKHMLVIQRLTRIYFLRKFFAYPIQLSLETLRTLGLIRTVRIMISFLWIRLFPRKPEKSLEDFIINKFGKQLYLLFFKDYTEKVWGVPCHEISAEWGAQRIKGVSLSKAITQAINNLREKKKGKADLSQKSTETSLIEQFLYPKYGPGSLWEEVARQINEMGGKIYMNQDVKSIEHAEGVITAVNTVNSETGQSGSWVGDYFFSSMPVQELIASMGAIVPADVQEIAAGLQYRDFINVGILLRQLSAPGKEKGEYIKLDLKDNWIYIQERDVKVGRLMIYNNWGGGMVKDPNTVWIGMEYFSNKNDAFWAQDDEVIQGIAVMELEKMGLARADDVLDITVRRMEKTYPAYFGTYDRFDTIQSYTDQYPNLFLVGRNGMHKYNNADHSMLTAMVAVDNIATGITDKSNIWAINTEQEYHEEKKETAHQQSSRTDPVGSFADFVWNDKRNRAFTILPIAVFLLQFIIFKIRYPFANYMPDSYSYLETAYNNADVSMWPVAYSKFLRLISVFTHSDKIVVVFQYLFMQCSALLFIQTICYFFKPKRVSKSILYVFLLFNPLSLYVSNYISADALFIGLSLLWLTSLLWIICRPRPHQIIVQGILLLFVFTVRYNAIYYPIIAGLSFLLSPQSWKIKSAGIGLGILLVAVSILYTSNKMQEKTGYRQFSAFGGWQMANNALYMYEHIPAAQRGPIPARFAKLEKAVRQHMDTLNKVKFSHEDSISSFFYLWSPRGPLVNYMSEEWKKDSTTSYFKRWASEGPLYKDYAFYLIRQYPLTFMQEFMLPNAIKLVVPPLEFIGLYNMGNDSVGQLAKEWFNYKSQKVSQQKKGNQIRLFSFYPILVTIINCCFLLGCFGFLFFSGIKKMGRPFSLILLLIVFFILCNAGFSIFASPIVLRYQVFPSFVGFTIATLLLEFIITEDKKPSLNPSYSN